MIRPFSKATQTRRHAHLPRAQPSSATCDGKEGAFGLRTDNSRGMSLNAPLHCAIGNGSYPAYGAALVTSVEDGIVFGSSFVGEGVTVLAGTPWSMPMVTAAFRLFSDGVGASTRQATRHLLPTGWLTALAVSRAMTGASSSSSIAHRHRS